MQLQLLSGGTVQGTTIRKGVYILLALALCGLYWSMQSKQAAPSKGNDCFLCNWFGRSKNQNAIQVPRAQPLPPKSVPVATQVPTIMASTEQQEDHDDDVTNLDFAKADYRGFVMAIHPEHGYMLLHCTRKKKKPNHFQLPGGHVDDFEFKDAAAVHPDDPKAQLQLAGQMGSARELYEETGMDLRAQLNRLQPAKLYAKEKKNKLSNEFKHRLFYKVELTDDDFLKEQNMPIADTSFLQHAMGAQPPPFKVSLSTDLGSFVWRSARHFFLILLTIACALIYSY